MPMFQVRKHQTLLYPDGSVRGERGYVVDGTASYERGTLAEQGAKLERVRDRQTKASPVLIEKLTPPPVEESAAPAEDPAEEAAPVSLVSRVLRKKKVAKKKAAKKKAD